MEVTTTMVVFELQQRQFETQTDKAVLILLYNEQGEEAAKEWVPLSKIEFEQQDGSDTYDVIMPKWLYYKKDVLPACTQVKREFVITTYADKYELLAAARNAQ